MRRIGVWLLAALGALAVVTAFAWGAVSNGWFVARQDPAVLAARLTAEWDVYLPEDTAPDAGPFPTVVQFHGCSGARGNQRAWAEFWAAQGYAAIVVDSLDPRGIGELEARARVCSGLTLQGSERAGDVLAALDAAARLPFVDEDRLFAAGWSHGAWSVMDLLTMDLEREHPLNLRDWPRRGLPDLAGVVLVYPHCGTLSRSRKEGWAHEIPALFLLAEEDKVVDTELCTRAAERIAASGVPVAVHVYPDVDHGFDVPDIPWYVDLQYHPDLSADAKARALAWAEAQLTEG